MLSTPTPKTFIRASLTLCANNHCGVRGADLNGLQVTSMGTRTNPENYAWPASKTTYRILKMVRVCIYYLRIESSTTTPVGLGSNRCLQNIEIWSPPFFNFVLH